MTDVALLTAKSRCALQDVADPNRVCDTVHGAKTFTSLENRGLIMWVRIGDSPARCWELTPAGRLTARKFVRRPA